MKRKIVAVLLAAVMVIGITACGDSEPAASDITAGRDRTTDEETKEETEKPEETEKTEETKEEEDKEKESDGKDKTAAKGVVFGSDEASGYSGFEYLMEELISTSETKSGNKASFSVFVPEDDYPSVSGHRARSERMGVTFEIDIEPYIQYKAEDYTVSENLEKYVNDQFSYSSYKYGIEIGDVEEISDDSATCLVTYMDYDSYHDTYAPVYECYKLEDIGDGIMVLTMVSIDAEDATGKTQALLDELSSFYQIDIDWDDSFAEAKREAFENSDEYNADAFNLIYMSFELPDGWEKDEKNSTYSEPIFAPGGNARKANGYIGISKEYYYDNYVELLLDDIEDTEKTFEEQMGDSVSDVKVEAVEDTFMGEMAKVEMKYDDDIDGTGTGFVYYGYYNHNIYIIAAFISDDADEDEALDVKAALDMIFETGKMKD